MNFFRVFLSFPVCEHVLLYTLNPQEAFKIDPLPEHYLHSEPEEVYELPVGTYYFTQLRKEQTESGGLAENSELTEMAIELQKEALWSRFKLENKIYLRKLFEDNSPVIQLWRPILPNSGVIT